MSLLRRRLKFGKSAMSRGSFKSLTGQKNSNPKPMGLPRVISTSAVLSFAAAVTYVAILYLFPFVNPKQIVGISPHNQAMKTVDEGHISWLKDTFSKPFELKRGFVNGHQGIRAHYIIPAGTKSDIVIEHCMRAIIVEAFKCKVVGFSKATIPSGTGSRRFTFSRAGFYQFKDQLRYADSGEIVPQSERQGYSIIWARY